MHVLKFESAQTDSGNIGISYSSQADANAQAFKMDTDGCTNCYGCTDCIDCDNCRNCKECLECQSCNFCIRQKGLTRVEFAIQ